MRKIKLTSLAIQNFKGCDQLTLDFGTTTNIYGANATGKTTIADAFTWLLFGTDTTGTTRFDVRPLDADGNTIDSTDIKVAAVLDVDGETIVLKKIQRQNWTKKRGELEPRLTGNTNLFEINGFPASDAEFKAKVSEIIQPGLFKLLTDPRTFAGLPWKEQRDILVELVPEVSDVDIAAEDPDKYGAVLVDLKAAGAEKCLEKAKAELKRINKTLDEYPARIDQATKAVIKAPSKAELDAKSAELDKKLAQIATQREDAEQTYQAAGDLRADVMLAKLDAEALINQANIDLSAKRNALQNDVAGHRLVVETLEDDLKNNQARLNELKKRLDAGNALGKKIAGEWKKTNAMELDPAETVCKMCGQKLPEDQVETIRKEFGQRKSDALNDIISAIKTNRANLDSISAEMAGLKDERKGLEDKLTAEKSALEDAQAQLAKLPTSVDPMDVDGYPEALQHLEDLQAQLAATDTGDEVRAELAEREENIREEINTLKMEYAVLDVNAKQQATVDELRTQQKATAQLAANQERKVYLLEELSKTKMERMADGINAKFKAVRFKLFETQMNGAVVPTCQTTMGGVPYASLNSAGKLQAGMDVIGALQELYGVCAPIWIDNRESVSELPVTSAQTINLYVSPADKELRVEVVAK